MVNSFFLILKKSRRLSVQLWGENWLPEYKYFHQLLQFGLQTASTPLMHWTFEDWGWPGIFLKDWDSNDYNYPIVRSIFFHFNQRCDFPHRFVATSWNLDRKYRSLSKSQVKKIFLENTGKKIREFSRNIYKNSRESRIQKSREFSKFLAREISREKP